MTQTAPASPELQMQFDRFEAKLEDWRDQLTQLGPFLPAGDLAKMNRRWDIMRQNLDTIFLHYGRSPARLLAVMEGLPALRELTQEELDMTLEAMVMARKSLIAFTDRSQKRGPLLEGALKNGENPERIRRFIDKMRVLEESFATRLQTLRAAALPFDHVAGNANPIPLLDTTKDVIDRSQRVEALRGANRKLADQKHKMESWLLGARHQLASMPANPPPSPGALSGVSQTLAPEKSDVDKALESLFANRDKLREARAYLETLLSTKEQG